MIVRIFGIEESGRSFHIDNKCQSIGEIIEELDRVGVDLTVKIWNELKSTMEDLELNEDSLGRALFFSDNSTMVYGDSCNFKITIFK